MAESLQQILRRDLLAKAAAGSAAFETSGVLPLSKPLEVYFKGHNNQPGCVSRPACTCHGCSVMLSAVLVAVLNCTAVLAGQQTGHMRAPIASQLGVQLNRVTKAFMQTSQAHHAGCTTYIHMGSSCDSTAGRHCAYRCQLGVA